jgi:hypothetical protein
MQGRALLSTGARTAVRGRQRLQWACLAEYEVVRAEDLAEGTRAHAVHGAWLLQVVVKQDDAVMTGDNNPVLASELSQSSQDISRQ